MLAERLHTNIYADEEHEYHISAFSNLLATGSRKFAIGYKVYSQTPSLYSDQDADLLFACCATQVAFNLDRTGAERLAREVFTFSGT